MQTFRDAYRSRHVLWALTSRQLKAQYRSTALGFVWALLNPLVMVTVLSTIWIYFFRTSLEAPAMIIVALIPYNFFSYCLSGCTVSVTGYATLVKKVFFPRQILPFSIVASSLVHLGIQALLIVVVLCIFPTRGTVIGWQLLWLVPLLVLMVGLCLGCGLLASALTVVYRDTEYIVQSALTVLFWATPVVYDAGAVFAERAPPAWVQVVYFANPLASLIEGFRDVLFHGTAPDAMQLALATLGTAAVGALGIRVFFVHERNFADFVR